MCEPGALTRAFWDVVDFPIPPCYDLELLPGKIKSALQRHNYRSRVSILAYGGSISDELGESLMIAGIRYWQEVEKRRRLSMMLLEILNFVYAMKVDPTPEKLHLIVISKDIPQMFAPMLEDLKLLYGNLEIHLVVPHDCVLERQVLYDTSKLVW